MRSGRAYGLFEVYGLELEYMVVDKKTLNVRPIVDQIIQKKIGEITSDVDNGAISWSNELTSHVIELKTSLPTNDLLSIMPEFQKNIREINSILNEMGAMLLPSAAHPTMDPFRETKIWEHEYNEIYTLYNQIFDCRGHGWSNVQSFHINLPFQHDIDFEKLHAAIRLILPILPALAASSPILDGRFTGYMDARMEAYSRNQERLPSLMGKLIPEQVFSEVNYHKIIYEPIQRDIKPYDKEKIMDHHFLNSRGAIARFDRGAIEIRVLDIQECPLADIAICNLIAELLKAMTSETWTDLAFQKDFHEDELRLIFDRVIRDGSQTMISDHRYLSLFGLDQPRITAQDLWIYILQKVKTKMPDIYVKAIDWILENGNLAERIIHRTGHHPSPESVQRTYRELALCLQENRLLQ